MHEETILWHLSNGMTFHGRTLIMTWIVMVVCIIFCLLGVRKLTSGKPGKMQNLLEFIVDLVDGIAQGNLGSAKARVMMPYLLSLITFIFFSNMFGLLPNFTFKVFSILGIEHGKLNEIFGGSSLMSPTADINTTLALALLTFCLIFIMGIRYKGVHYFKHFLEPTPVFALIHVIDLISKPMTLAFRLFGNIFAGEILLGVILMLPGFFVFAGSFMSAVWLAFSIFIGCIQSYVFTVLTTAYIAQAAVSEEH
ncbi:MAG: F0F1 ATP synthase subunit A [Peptococcaceae bacterium]|jgi:F-type H+-transporting ATPase subunit a|nr:F0F1 ATP synthase subunit A [Peptococcaceae bacterium]